MDTKQLRTYLIGQTAFCGTIVDCEWSPQPDFLPVGDRLPPERVRLTNLGLITVESRTSEYPAEGVVYTDQPFAIDVKLLNEYTEIRPHPNNFSNPYDYNLKFNTFYIALYSIEKVSHPIC